MSDFNCVILRGRLVADPEVKQTSGGKNLCSFTVVVNKTWMAGGDKKEKASFVDCYAWEKTGDTIAKFFKRGSQILIRGEIDQQTWEVEGQKKSKIKVQVNEFNFIDRLDKSEKAEQKGSEPSQPEAHPAMGDDDIPF